MTTRNRRKAERLEHAYDDIERRIEELAAEEELAAVRPALDGETIMRILDLPPGPVVGMAYKFLLDLRLDEGPLEEAEAIERLRTWWAEQDIEKLSAARGRGPRDKKHTTGGSND